MNTAYAVRRFLALTFLISLGAFILIALVPGAQSPESKVGLPIWLLAVWSPTLAAGWLLHRDNHLGATLRARLGAFPSPAVWGVVALPILVAGVVVFSVTLPTGRTLDTAALTPGSLLPVFVINLVLGPLGEELGWRGYLQPAWEARVGWLLAALGVGVVWAIWHAPLWLVDSPQRAIPFSVFAVHVLAYSVIFACAQRLADGSLWPAILLHLGVNVVGAVVVMAGAFDVAGWYSTSAPIYALVATSLALSRSSGSVRQAAAVDKVRARR